MRHFLLCKPVNALCAWPQYICQRTATEPKGLNPRPISLRQLLFGDGDTGPYVQYAATRLGAILKKANWDPESGAGDLTLLTDPSEKRLVLHLAAFPVACRRSAIELKPSVLAQWCFTMAQEITKFYHDVNVLESEFGVKQARLRLIAATQSVLIQGLDLLGIPMPDEM